MNQIFTQNNDDKIKMQKNDSLLEWTATILPILALKHVQAPT